MSSQDKEYSVSLTHNEAIVLKAAIEDWIKTTSQRRIWPWRKVGWVDAVIYSRGIYASARDKLDEALKQPKEPA